MQRGGRSLCFPAVENLFGALIFLVIVMLLIEFSQRPPLETRDVRVWSDDVERRLLSSLPPRRR
jgi:hypothetical protein